MQMISFMHFICLPCTFFALTVLYMFMLLYLALNEQTFCFFLVSSFVLCWSEVQIFLQIGGGIISLSAPSYHKLLSWGLQNVMPRSPLGCLQQVRWWVGSECFYEEPPVLLHYIIVCESPTLLLNISEQCTQQRINLRSRQQDLSCCSQNY